MAGFLGVLAQAVNEQKKRESAEQQQAIENNFKNALIQANMRHLDAETENLNNPNWQTREGADGYYQANPRTGETRKLSDIPFTPKPPPRTGWIKQVDENGYVYLVDPADPSNPKQIMGRNGKPMKATVRKEGARSVGVAPAPIRIVEKQISDTREDIKRDTPKPLGPLSTSADSASFRSKNQRLGPLTQRLDSLSNVRDRMAGEQQGKAAAPVDPTAGMSDADAWEYWVAQGATPSEATAKVNSRSKR